MNYIERECPICGKKYTANITRLKFGRETTCSRACSYKLRSDKISNNVTINCSNCGIEFTKCVSQVKSKHGSFYCSPKCQYEGRSKGMTKRIVNKPYVIVNPISEERMKEISKMRVAKRRANGTLNHTEETKNKLSHITAKNIADGKINRISKIEYLVFDALQNAGIDFIHQFPIRNNVDGRFIACVDFFIPLHNIAIEVNGTFWHADKRFYDAISLSPAQKRTLTKYSNKIKVLKEHNFQLIEVWEYDLKSNLIDTINNLVNKIQEH